MAKGPKRTHSFNTSEAAKRLGVSRNTLLRWFREGRISETQRDFRGWRRFTERDIARIKIELEQGAIEATHEAPSAVIRENEDGVLDSPRLQFLRQVPLFASLSNNDLIAMDAVAEYRGFSRGSILFHEGQEVLGLHVLLKGRIKLTKQSPEGREQILEIVEPVSTFAETPLFDKTGRYPTLGRASLSSRVLIIPRTPLGQLVSARPSLSLAFLGAFAERMKDLMRKVEEATFLTVDERLARYIRQEADKGVIHNVNVMEIAAMIGAARESVSRSLGRLNKAEIIALRSGRLFVLDDSLLAQIA